MDRRYQLEIVKERITLWRRCEREYTLKYKYTQSLLYALVVFLKSWASVKNDFSF
jgi:hypothetical protein